jgi:hypothetical protein
MNWLFTTIASDGGNMKVESGDGAENHCQSGALSFKDEVVFNWLDETLKLNGGRKDKERLFVVLELK